MKKVLPPTYLLAAILMMTGLHFLAPIARVAGWPWRWAGVVPLAAGIIINLVANKLFRRHRTTVKPFRNSAALVTAGPYRFSRHPMYAGMVAALAGIALLLGSLGPWFAVAAFAILMDRRFIRVEERMLEETFGDVFRDYKRRVRRWI